CSKLPFSEPRKYIQLGKFQGWKVIGRKNTAFNKLYHKVKGGNFSNSRDKVMINGFLVRIKNDPNALLRGDKYPDACSDYDLSYLAKKKFNVPIIKVVEGVPIAWDKKPRKNTNIILPLTNAAKRIHNT